MSRRTIALAGLLTAAAALSGCGKVGQLERPGPLFGHAPVGEAADAPPPQDPNRPVETVDPRDRSTDNAPSRTLRIPGAGPSATDTAPRSSLPDPYADPRPNLRP